MRSKYETRAIVLSRAHTGEANTFVTLLTRDLGLVHARAQSLRKPHAKLAHALTTLSESGVMLVRGKEGWRVMGAVLEENWFVKLKSPDTRAAAARVSGLLLRLVAGETQDVDIFPIMKGFFGALTNLPADMHEAAEILVVIRLLAVLGLDQGDIPGGGVDFTSAQIDTINTNRASYVTRINIGIEASGL